MIGPLIISFKVIYQKIESKLEQIHKQFLYKFGDILGQSQSQLHQDLVIERVALEKVTFANINELKENFECFYNAKEKLQNWTQILSKF